MNTYTIHAQNISYKIKQRTIINNISMQIDNNKITGFLGPNGAGKTTFFHILAGLIPIKSGKILLNNTNITKLATHQRLTQGIAFLPQNSSIFQSMSVANNILAGLDYQANNFSNSQKQELLNDLLSQFNLNEIKSSLGINLSGGERRRVELARCLIMQPKFILLDEPFSGIDPVTIKETQKILKKIAKSGTGILISDHNANDTLKVCNSVYLLHQGKILTHDTPSNIINNKTAISCYFGEPD